MILPGVLVVLVSGGLNLCLLLVNMPRGVAAAVVLGCLDLMGVFVVIVHYWWGEYTCRGLLL